MDRRKEMYVKKDIDFSDLDSFFWSGARDRWSDATDDQKERVWELIQEVFCDDVPTDTMVNDFVWFECDDIFFEEEDEDDEDEEDDDDDEEVDDFIKDGEDEFLKDDDSDVIEDYEDEMKHEYDPSYDEHR